MMRSHLYATLRSSARMAQIAGIMALVPYALRGQGTITGTVLDSLGAPVSGAQITVDSTSSRAVSNDAGEFRLSGLTAGSVHLHFRRLGYAPEARTVSLQANASTHIDVRLSPLPIHLETVEVRRRVEAFDSRLAGFNARRERHVGHFVTREDLDRMSSARFVDALRSIPGVQLRSLRSGGTSLVLRGSHCPPLVFIDGFPADAGVMDLDMIDLASVEGVEIYSGVASVPPEFMGARGQHGCGVVAIWSRPTRARRQRIAQASEVDLEKLLAARAVYTSDQVDNPARLTPASASPVYPDSLWHAAVAGRVVAEFIVDAEGAIEPGSLRIVSSTHPYFTSAVKSALGDAAFTPARLDGQAVRQIVQLPFVFAANVRDSVPPLPE